MGNITTEIKLGRQLIRVFEVEADSWTQLHPTLVVTAKTNHKHKDTSDFTDKMKVFLAIFGLQ